MNRRIAAWTIAAVAVLGLTACSGSATDTADHSDHTAASAAAKPAAADQTVTEACLDLAGPLADASKTMADLAQASTDPQTAVDAWSALVKAYDTAADTVSNADVKAAAADVAEDTAAVRDQLSKVYVDKDTSAMSDFTTADGDMQTSLTALTTLCAG